MKNKMPVDIYDFVLMPKEKQQYIVLYGRHMNKLMYEHAASLMRRENKQTGKMDKIPAFRQDEVDNILKRHNVTVENKGGWDYVYVAQKARADYLGGSVPDEQRLAMHIKEVCDDVDAPDGLIFREWCVRMDAAGEGVPWEKFYE